MSDLASGWQLIRFCDLGTWFGGGTPSKSDSRFWDHGSVPWLSPKDMGSDVISDTRDRITLAAVSETSVRLVPAGSVAVVVRSGILERLLPIGLVPFQTTLNQDMKAVVPHPGVDPRWIAWGLRAYEGQLLRECRKAGTTVASIEMLRFLSQQLPVPPIEAQRRIIDILEDHLSRLGAVGQSTGNSAGRVRRLRQAVLSESLVRAGTEFRRLGDLARVGSGATPLKSRSDYYDGGSIPWITSGDLRQSLIIEPKHFVTEVAVRETAVKIYPVGTLLVAMYGEGKTRGTAAELGIDATTNQACAAIDLHPENQRLRPWVRLFLDSHYWALRRLAVGGVQPNLSLGLIKSLELPIPRPDLMDELLRRNAAWREAEVRLASGLSTARARVVAFRHALLQAAFSGQLTGASSDVEIAEELASV